jgi:hypothetical protein
VYFPLSGVFFEYRVYDPYNYKQIRAWSNCTHKTDIGWLDWRKKGPGNGLYRLYVRAVDPAGNRVHTDEEMPFIPPQVSLVK